MIFCTTWTKYSVVLMCTTELYHGRDRVRLGLATTKMGGIFVEHLAQLLLSTDARCLY